MALTSGFTVYKYKALGTSIKYKLPQNKLSKTVDFHEALPETKPVPIRFTLYKFSSCLN